MKHFVLITGVALALAPVIGIAAMLKPETNRNADQPAATPQPAAVVTGKGPVFEWKDPQVSQSDHLVELRLWISPKITRCNAIILLTPGYSGDGRPMADDAAFQKLAEDTGCALLACHLKGEQNGGYADPARWSGNVILRAIRDLGKSSGHSELAEAPLAFWGHSAGGMFNYNFACWKPERVIAFVANKGGYYSTRTSEKLFRVPGIWFAGSKDEDVRIQNIASFFVAGRRRGAPWALAVEPNAGHEVGRTKEVGIAYLEAMIPLRLGLKKNGETAADQKLGAPPEAASADGPKIVPVTDQAWVGDLASHDIKQADAQPDPHKINAWLPDEPFAKLWRSFVNGTPASGPAK